MFDPQEQDQEIRALLINICEVMHRRGYREVPLGILMRLVGVDDTYAKKHDDEYIVMSDEFKNEFSYQQYNQLIPPGTTIH